MRTVLQEGRLGRLFWTFLDQGLVSAGGFVVQVTLARSLPPAEYGVFSLIFNALMLLQLVNTALVQFPMSVDLAAATEAKRPSLLGASLTLLMALTLGLAVALVAVMVGLNRPDLIIPGLAFLFAWQLQEGLRRGLFAALRHKAAVIGDSVSYLGQAIGAVALAMSGLLSLSALFYVMAGCAVCGAMVHARFQRVARPSGTRLRVVAARFWQLGGLASLSNGLLSHLRILVLPWLLAFQTGTSTTASFQAMMNITNLINPLIIGLGNIIPQTVAGSRDGGLELAWRVARAYAMIAAPPVALYLGLVFVMPEATLQVFYGDQSTYLGLALPLRLLVLGALVGFVVEAILAFLMGAAMVGTAARINLAGTLASVGCAAPLVFLHGVAGACAALVVANVLRLVLAWLALGRARLKVLAPPIQAGVASP